LLLFVFNLFVRFDSLRLFLGVLLQIVLSCRLAFVRRRTKVKIMFVVELDIGVVVAEFAIVSAGITTD
jgi:hypothetical protein